MGVLQQFRKWASPPFCHTEMLVSAGRFGCRRLLSTFAERADLELCALQHAVEHSLEESNLDEFDVDLQDGVLKISINSNHYVINKQTPNQQIWWSSPLSGPRRYEFDDAAGAWTCVRDGRALRADFVSEMAEIEPELPPVVITDEMD